MLSRLAMAYADAYARRPLPLAVATGLTVKTGADAFAQLAVEGRPRLDARRTLAMAAFSATVGGGCNYVFVREASRLLAALGGGARGAAAAAAADVCVFCPLLYLPTYTLAMGAAAGASLDQVAAQLRAGYGDSWAASAAIMGPAQLANFLFVPYALRLPVMLSAAFAYNATVSVINMRVSSRTFALAGEARDAVPAR